MSHGWDTDALTRRHDRPPQGQGLPADERDVMDGPSKSEAMRLLRPLMESSEVLSVNPVLGDSACLVVRVAKQDDALERRVRDALRKMGWPVQIAGPLPKSSA